MAQSETFADLWSYIEKEAATLKVLECKTLNVPKSCQKPRRPSVAQRKKQLSSLDCVNLLDR